MHLTDEEKRMLDGAYGSGTQKAMSIISRFGEVVGAEKTVPLSSVSHIPLEPFEWLLDMSAGDAKVRAFTTTHAQHFDPKAWRAMGIQEKYGLRAEAVSEERNQIYRRMGIFLTHSCAPYTVGNVPKQGSYFAWGGSAGQVLANSLLGARGDRVGGPLILAGGITGRAPYTGLCRPENRRGQFLVQMGDDLKQDEMTYAHYGAISYYVGALAEARNVVYDGVRQDMPMEGLKYLFSPLPVSGAVALCHVVGLTPEAPTLDAALGGQSPEERIVVGKAEMRAGWERLHTAVSDDVEVVGLGCPHATIREVEHIAHWLEGKKVSANTRLWVCTASQTRLLAERSGVAQIIEKAGGVLTESCIGGASPFQFLGMKSKVLAVDSPRSAHYVYRQTDGNTTVAFGTREMCLNAAITGKWEGGNVA